MKHADMAMYAAKQAARIYRFYPVEPVGEVTYERANRARRSVFSG